jgi:hypothetical protein
LPGTAIHWGASGIISTGLCYFHESAKTRSKSNPDRFPFVGGTKGKKGETQNQFWIKIGSKIAYRGKFPRARKSSSKKEGIFQEV